MAEERAVARLCARSPRPRATARPCCFPAASGTTAAACRRCSTRARRCSRPRARAACASRSSSASSEACDRGMRAIVLRAGDFFGGGRGSWFDLVIAKDIERSRLTYPGPARRRACLGLPARFRRRRWCGSPSSARGFGAFETFGFPGHAVTGQRVHRDDRGGHQEQVHAAADELVVSQDHRAIDGARPRAVRARISLARAAPDLRRQAQGGDRRDSAHAVAGGDRALRSARSAIESDPGEASPITATRWRAISSTGILT